MFVCSYECVVYRNTCRLFSRGETVTLHIRKNTQKSKFLLSQAFKWEKIMFFVIPEMPSKTFVMVLKNFLITLIVQEVLIC